MSTSPKANLLYRSLSFISPRNHRVNATVAEAGAMTMNFLEINPDLSAPVSSFASLLSGDLRIALAQRTSDMTTGLISNVPYNIFLYLRNGKTFFPFREASKNIANLYKKGQELRSTPIIVAASIWYAILQGRFVEPEIKRIFNPEHILQDRNRSIDSIVLFWTYCMRGLPINLMTNVVDILGGENGY